MSEGYILFYISYDDFISSENIFRLLNLSTRSMEIESYELQKFVPAESAKNKLNRFQKAANNKKSRTTDYLKGMSYQGRNIKNSELTEIYIYIKKENTDLINDMKKIRRNEKSFMQISENQYNFV